MKILLPFVLILFLYGCDSSKLYETDYYKDKMPPDLSDCKVYDGRLTVVRCPNSTTTTNYIEGKTRKSIVVIDGQEYKRVEK